MAPAISISISIEGQSGNNDYAAYRWCCALGAVILYGSLVFIALLLLGWVFLEKRFGYLLCAVGLHDTWNYIGGIGHGPYFTERVCMREKCPKQ